MPHAVEDLLLPVLPPGAYGEIARGRGGPLTAHALRGVAGAVGLERRSLCGRSEVLPQDGLRQRCIGYTTVAVAVQVVVGSARDRRRPGIPPAVRACVG